MRADARLLLVPLLAAAALACSGCSRAHDGIRIGVLADCRGLFAGLQDLMLGGAELPLIERGARLRGPKPSNGITRAKVRGREVELVSGCSELGEFTVLVQETRRLVEHDHVDVIVGTVGGGDGIVLRELARRYPNVAFVIAGTATREVTSVRAPRNLFRFQPDDAQSAAGLGTYAYRRLGWRRAALVADDDPNGWGLAAAFAAEFCAQGGEVVDRQLLSGLEPSAPHYPTGVDGATVMLSTYPQAADYIRAVARRLGPGRLILGPRITQDPFLRGAVGPALIGAVTSSPLPLPFSNPAVRRFELAYRRAFPTAPPDFASGLITREYYDGVDAVLRAIDAAPHGSLVSALGRVTLDVPGGRISLDARRQAVVPVALLRVTKGAAFKTINVLRGVDQTLRGALPEPEIGPASVGC